MRDWSWRINCHWLKLGDFFRAHPLIIRANRAHPYASAFVHMQGIERSYIRLCKYLMYYCFVFLCRPDHLSCHVKHVHSSERPFKCQVTVRVITVHLIIIGFVVICVCCYDPLTFDPVCCVAYRPVPLLLPPKTDSVPTWSGTKAKSPVASVGRCSVQPTLPAIWRLTDRPTLTPVTKVLYVSLVYNTYP